MQSVFGDINRFRIYMNLQLTVMRIQWEHVCAVGPARKTSFDRLCHWVDRGKNRIPAFTTFATFYGRLQQLKSHITQQTERFVRNGNGMCWVLMRNAILCSLKQLFFEQCFDAVRAKELPECTWHTFVEHHECIQEQLSFLFDSGGVLHF